MYVKNEITTSNNYTDASTLECPGAIRVNVEVTQAEVYFQMREPVEGMKETSWGWGPETLSGRRSFSLARRTSAIRFRSKTAGQPALVNVQGIIPNDVGI